MKKVKKQTKKIDGRKQLGQIRRAYHQVKNQLSIDKTNWPGLTEQQIFIRTVKQSMNAGMTFKQAVKQVTSVGVENTKIAEAWEKKKDYYEERMETYGLSSKKELFMQEIKAYMKEKNPKTGKKYSLNQAVKAFESSTLIRSKGEIDSENFKKGMKEYGGEEFKKLRKKHGWKKSLEDVSVKPLVSTKDEEIYEVYTGSQVFGYVLHRVSPKSKGDKAWEFYDDYDEQLQKLEQELRHIRAQEEADRREREETATKTRKFSVNEYVKKRKKGRNS